MSTSVQSRPAPPVVGSRPRGIDRRRQFARRSRLSDLLVTLMWTSGAVAAALFLASGGAAQFSSIAGTVTALGIITGLVGTDFVLVMLVLAARVPVIDRAIGHDRAIALHRTLGKPALYLILAHAGLLLIGYGLAEGLNPIDEIGSMLAITDMPLAFIALGLMVLVVVSSLVAARRKLSYEVWHVIHLLSYVSVAFALPHQLSVGGVLAEGTAQRVYWIALTALAFGAVLVHRIIEPIVASLRHGLKVARVSRIAPGVTAIHLTGRRLRDLGSEGGQFYIWRFWTGRTWWHSHPISLSAMPTDSSARITVRDLGAGSRRISAVPVGTRVSLEGPYGLFSDRARTAPRLAIVAAGIGVTPVRALLEGARIAPGEATIVLRASGASETYHWDEIRQLAEAKGATVYTMIGSRARSGAGWMTQTDADRGVTMRSIFPDLLESDLYLCGPAGWLDLVEADARDLGIPAHQLHSERFDL
jgi:predicted ferric reductase